MRKIGNKSSRANGKVKVPAQRPTATKGDAVDRAIRQATRQAVLRHKKLGQSIVVWKNGRVVWLKPSQIK